MPTNPYQLLYEVYLPFIDPLNWPSPEEVGNRAFIRNICDLIIKESKHFDPINTDTPEWHEKQGKFGTFITTMIWAPNGFCSKKLKWIQNRNPMLDPEEWEDFYVLTIKLALFHIVTKLGFPSDPPKKSMKNKKGEWTEKLLQKLAFIC